ncbi:hypothetical protein [Burkholderia pseudomallei]|uniref:hypothetical protein n=1 Tax=Burkholderia pseudomallei TaxID=28450 RepID=UPI000AC3D6C9|nr:hypothetical protein [Burkholderia pseudomallei]
MRLGASNRTRIASSASGAGGTVARRHRMAAIIRTSARPLCAQAHITQGSARRLVCTAHIGGAPHAAPRSSRARYAFEQNGAGSARIFATIGRIGNISHVAAHQTRAARRGTRPRNEESPSWTGHAANSGI